VGDNRGGYSAVAGRLLKLGGTIARSWRTVIADWNALRAAISAFEVLAGELQER